MGTLQKKLNERVRGFTTPPTFAKAIGSVQSCISQASGTRRTGFRKKLVGGFTLVETLIGIAILVTAVLAPLAIAQSGIQAARYAQQQTTAIFLAQEAVELVKYQVAYNLNNGADATNWLDGLIPACSSGDCEVYGPKSIGAGALFQACGGLDPCKVYLGSNGLYRSHIDGTATLFTRKVKLNIINPAHEAKVIVTVSWQTSQGVPRSYVVEDYVYKWR